MYAAKFQPDYLIFLEDGAKLTAPSNGHRPLFQPVRSEAAGTLPARHAERL